MTYCVSANDPNRVGHIASPDGNLGDALLMRCGIKIWFSDLSEPEQTQRPCPTCRNRRDGDAGEDD